MMPGCVELIGRVRFLLNEYEAGSRFISGRLVSGIVAIAL